MSHIDFFQTKNIITLYPDWTTILTAPFISTKQDQAVKIDAYLLNQIQVNSQLEIGAAIQYRLLRNGVSVYESESVRYYFLSYLYNTNQRPATLVYVDQPASGAYTYELQARVTDSQFLTDFSLYIKEANMSVLVVDNTTPSALPVYVAYEDQSGNGYVAAVNSQTDHVDHTIAVGKQPGSICISPDGSSVYVVNEGDNTVSIIDTSSNSVSATVNVGSKPKAVMVTPDNTKAYVANYDGKTVSIINTTTKTVSNVVAIGAGNPFALTASPNSWYVYAACRVGDANDYVAAIAVDSGEVHEFAQGGWDLSFDIDHNPLVVSPDGHTVAVLGQKNHLRRINGPDDIGPGNTVSWLNQTVSGVYLNNGTFFATKSFTESVIKVARNLSIDGSGNVTADQQPDIPIVSGQNKIRISPDQTRVCVTITAHDDVFARIIVISVDPQTQAISTKELEIPVANDLAITYDGNKAYVIEIEYIHPVNIVTMTDSESIHFGNASKVKGIVGAYRSQS